jgi:aspartate kinase
MFVYKFGGASIRDTSRFKNAARIIGRYESKLIVVVSAMGKTTNALEKVAEAFYAKNNSEALQLFEAIKNAHILFGREVLGIPEQSVRELLIPVFTEVEWLLHDQPVRHYDYYYDQIVCSGELMSSILLNQYLQKEGLNATWIDVRDILKTDDNFRDATVIQPETNEQIVQTIKPLVESGIVVTQGFIGSTDINESTTLGREGSDYTAALMAQALDAASVTIWKDVDAVMNADPRVHENAVVIPNLDYHEVIEMAYYGAQVIHPKTIKPLQNKQIPLFVKSFLNPDAPGTTINANVPKNLPPVIIHKTQQVMMTFQSKDYSFVEGTPAEQLRSIFNTHKLKSNLSQHTAISYICSFDAHPEKINLAASEAAHLFEVSVINDLQLLTIRHFNEALLTELTAGKEILLEQRTTDTVQFLLK